MTVLFAAALSEGSCGGTTGMPSNWAFVDAIELGPATAEAILKYGLIVDNTASTDCGVNKTAARVEKRAISREEKRFTRFI